jgi:sarcosine oxidase delta subunit
MSFLIPCPNCGPRDVSEFRHGGEVQHDNGNLPGPQRERWYHRLGCRRWLLAVRDVRTNAVLETHRLEEGAS